LSKSVKRSVFVTPTVEVLISQYYDKLLEYMKKLKIYVEGVEYVGA
jgi:hypothetical protein